MKTEIYLGKVQIASVQSNAGVYYGDIVVKDWQVRSKSNSTLGRVSGDNNTIASRLNFLSDPDFIDMLVKTFK